MLLIEDEKIVHELIPEKRLAWVWFLYSLIPILIGVSGAGFAVLGTFFGFVDENHGIGRILSKEVRIFLWFVVLIIIPILVLIYQRLLCGTYKYTITNSRCIFQGGLLRRMERSVPFERITEVSISQNLIEQVLGVSTIRLYTAGTSGLSKSGLITAELSFSGLAKASAPSQTINSAIAKSRRNGA